ncbi:Octanoyltransferase LipM [Botrimarina colliarenosi]|uniref:Octanoyltransferase LipM n=1 Tax=Botrimarina colliarenosi TaxID=2528001 RepID=A0A5C6AI65_9BACT|nr:hypothetical protein [Botrimarina colliarenosi]TWT99100.1 Octanoyltransferase LipM [Botrimarina colliarenosi]
MTPKLFPLECRLIVDGPADGAWNMAVDEALLDAAAEGGGATLRLYQWAPTLSLGYFQRYADRAAHEASVGLPCVRRSSGGGALVHDHELTYSLTLPPRALAGLDTRALYCQAHRAVIAAVAELGGDAGRLSLCDPAKEKVAAEPFLCFQRRADGDLLVEERPFPSDPRPRAMSATAVRGRYKVCGSAQRKRRGALLQHGGVLLAQSAAAPELPGLADLGVLDADAASFAAALGRNLADLLALRTEPGELGPAEIDAARQIAAEKHGAEGWVQRR